MSKAGKGNGLARLAVLASVVTPAALLSLSNFYAYKIIDSTDMKKPVTVLPIIGATLWPLLALLTYKLMKKDFGLPFLLKPLKLVLTLPLVYLSFHNFFQCVYGNLNTLAFTNSVVIDVIAPPESFNIDAFNHALGLSTTSFEMAWNISQWKDSVRTAAVKYTDSMNCGPRSYVRFMTHEVLGGSALSDLVGEAVFQGAWAMVTGKKGTKWENKPRVYTVDVGGNDALFNNLIRWIAVDPVNQYHPYTVPDFHKGNLTYSIHGYPTESINSMTWKIGKEITAERFKMDQYSCMFESEILDKFMGKRWCFHKKMDMQQLFENSGSITHPMFKTTISYPTGSPTDCSKPYVRGYLLKQLRWSRENYYCDL